MKNLKHFGKRGLAVLIALVMCLSLLPMSAFAASTSGTDSISVYVGQTFVGLYNVGGSAGYATARVTYGGECFSAANYGVDEDVETYDWAGNFTGYKDGAWIKVTAAQPGQAQIVLTYKYGNRFQNTRTETINVTVLDPVDTKSVAKALNVGESDSIEVQLRMDGALYPIPEAADTSVIEVTSSDSTVASVSHNHTEDGSVFFDVNALKAGTTNLKLVAEYYIGMSYNLNGDPQIIKCTSITNVAITVTDPTPSHTHNYTNWRDNKDGTHTGTCNSTTGTCDALTKTEDHHDNGFGFCAECGACMHEKDPATGYCTDPNCDCALPNGHHKDCCQKAPVATPKLTVEKIAYPNNPNPGDEVKYMITVTNTGSTNVTGVVITDVLNQNLEFVKAEGTGGATWTTQPADGKYAFNDVTLLPGNETYNKVTLTITAKVKEGATGNISNTATAICDDLSTPASSNPADITVASPWTCDHEHYSDGSCKTLNCTHAAGGHDCCPTHFHADNDDDLTCDICGKSTVCFHPAGQCGDECKHPADCQCKKHVHKDEDPADGKCDDCDDCLHTPNSCGDECDHDATCQCKHTHKDENPADGKCDDCGVCLHNKDDQGYCTEENCQHGTDCCVKKPGDHQHKDEEPKDGKCDECGACMHEKDPATGYCTVEGCDHTGCCVKDPGKHQHKDEEPKDGKCDECGACMHKHEDGYCVDPDCKGTGDHSQCCTKKKAPQVTISNRYAPITVNNGVATAPYTVTVKNESGYPLYSLDIKDKLTTTVYQHGTTTPTDAVEIKVIPVDVTLNGTSIKDKVDLGGERTVSANATTNLQWTVLKGNETFADDAVVTLTYNVTIRLTGNVGVDYRFNNTAKGVTDTEYKPAPEVAMASYQAPVYFEKFETEETNTGAGNIPDSDPDPVTPPSGGDTGTGGTLLPDSGGNQGGNEGGNQGGGNQGGGNQGGGNQGGGNDPDDIYIPDDPTPLNPTPVTPPEVEIDDPATPLASANGLNSVDHFAYIAGYTDGTVRPESNITRAEVATIFYRLMTDVYRAANWSDTNDFSDVNAGDWFNNAVSTCAKAGIVSGYSNGTFAPNQAITRAEFATIAARFLDEEITGENAEGFSDIDGHWAKANILRAAEAGWVNGDNGRFRPDNYITRAEVMTIVNRMLNRLADKEHMLDDMKVWPDNPETAWYYEAVQEATNSHQYESLEETHDWTELDEDPDWSALEKEWAAG